MTNATTGFATTDDGLQLYYRAMGEGPPLACCNGVGVSTFFWKYIALHFRDRYRVIQWDYRGHGRSTVPRSIPGTDWSMERNARDLQLVLDDLGVDEPAILLGHSMGCQVILEAQYQAPERVAALIPMFGTYGRALDTFMGLTFVRPALGLIRRVASRMGRGSLRWLLPLYANRLALPFSRATGLVDPYYAARADMNHYLEHLQHMDPKVFLEMVQAMGDHDLEHHLPHIDVPTLVFGGEHDLFTPIECSRHMAARIPGAELTIVAEGSHAAIVEHPETINRRIDRFLRERLGG